MIQKHPRAVPHERTVKAALRPATPGFLPGVRCAAILLAILGLPELASAKCPIPVVNVSGKVVDAEGHGLSNAVVGVAWLRLGEVEGPVLGLSGTDGEFTLRFQFHTISSSGHWFGGERCRARLESLSATAMAPGLHFDWVSVGVHDWHAQVLL